MTVSELYTPFTTVTTEWKIFTENCAMATGYLRIRWFLAASNQDFFLYTTYTVYLMCRWNRWNTGSGSIDIYVSGCVVYFKNMTSALKQWCSRNIASSPYVEFRRLISKGADMEKRNGKGETALSLAVDNLYYKMLGTLLQNLSISVENLEMSFYKLIQWVGLTLPKKFR